MGREESTDLRSERHPTRLIQCEPYDIIHLELFCNRDSQSFQGHVVVEIGRPK